MPERQPVQLSLFEDPADALDGRPASPVPAPDGGSDFPGHPVTQPPIHPDYPAATYDTAGDLSPEDGSREDRAALIRTACLQCVSCDLSATRTQVVFGEGNLHSPLVIVGEGPGEQEDATGRPFVGRAGAMLDQALRENGILRQHVWITNVLKCRACLVEGRRIQNRPPRVDEVEACRPWLSEELAIVRPLVILCVGGPAASWIIHPEFRILRERGRWFSTPWAAAAMATLHPAFVLRQQGGAYEESRATLVRDIGEARRKVIELKKAAVQRPGSEDAG